MIKKVALLIFLSLTGCTVQTQRVHLITPEEIRSINDNLSSVQSQQRENMRRLEELEVTVALEDYLSRATFDEVNDHLFSIEKLTYSINTSRNGSALWFSFQGIGDPLEGMGFPKELQF